MKIVGKSPDGQTKAVLTSLDDLSDSGILWYLNRVAFHPRGMALAFGEDDEGNMVVELWYNNECWTMPEDVDDEKHKTFEEVVDELRRVCNEPEPAIDESTLKS
jgi:hypothetical protein